MPCNESTIDRLIRALIIAPLAVLAAWYFQLDSIAGIVALAVAGIMLMTAAVGFCPLYKALGVNTCSVKPAEHK